ncbi:MAG: cyclopropane fatty acyl phospholipid synthase, partial [Verrucomicrobiota bacterium]
LGLGESYVDGWWECDALDQMFHRVLRARLDQTARIDWRAFLAFTVAKMVNLQTRRGARKVGREHYDLGNDFFEAMLDPAMQYSCAYFKGADDLATAQQQKMDLIARKLDLQPGKRLLDIGCGWGGLARYAAEQYQCEVVGVTISKEQQAYAAEVCRGLPVDIRLQDYRDVRETFDSIVSVGMLEHVGAKNYRTYFETAARCLHEEGRFLCHSIACNQSGLITDPWISRYIFPNSMLPTAAQISTASEGLFVIEDVHNFGADYDRTLMSWEANFDRSWDRFTDQYGDRFKRMWRYYLLSCAGAFRARDLQLFQFLLTKRGLEGGWAPVR